ncbi:unnamed protein product [Phytophthora lilii]|uniref:Unnamed protein product n=1 Tax=Phytophthora lilii TaxID=2077276 RepID=A0A9W6TU83_9STRA|nr:unnamed protein product [Phytophthora lilii]
MGKYDDTLNILSHDKHAFYITSVERVQSMYSCPKCSMVFENNDRMRAHSKNKCDQVNLESFVAKPTIYNPPENRIKRLLSKYSIKNVNHYLDHFIVFDFEAILKPLSQQHGSHISFDNQHIPGKFKAIYSSIDKHLTNHEKANPGIMDGITIENINAKRKEDQELNTFLKTKEKISKDLEILHQILDQTPVIGFNTGNYDINLIKNELFSAIGTENIKYVIKNGGYMAIATNTYKMLDMINCVPPGTSYDKYLATYLGGCRCDDKIRCTCELSKGVFPYEYITSFDVLNETELPPKSAFYSKLRCSNISDDEYKHVQFVWGHYGMKTLKDLLIWYNNLDVGPFIKAIQKQRELFKRFDLDMFAGGVSLPGLSEKVMYKTQELIFPTKKAGTSFDFPGKRYLGYIKQDEDANREFSMTMQHLDKLLKKQKFMCNYCYCKLSEETAFFRYKKLLEFNADRLVYSIDDEESEIYRKMKANIAGGPSIIFNRFAKRNETFIRGGKLCKKVIGYDANALYLWCLGNFMPCGRLTTIEPYDSIIDDIQADKIFGFLECDIETPEHLKEYFSEMTPIFKNTEIEPTAEIIGKHMFDYNQSRGKNMAKKSRKLIGSYFGKQILIYTPLLKWYLAHGMVSDARRSGDETIKMVSTIIKEKASPEMDDLETEMAKLQADPTKFDKDVINGFISKYANTPLVGLLCKLKSLSESSDSKSMIADMMKLVGNAAFGRSGMDMTKHKEVEFLSNEKSVLKATEHFTFSSKTEFNDETVEMVKSKRRIKLKNPIHLSIAIYQLAKLRMLQFYYDCIDFYFDRSDFQYQEMDTDSGYIAFSHETPFPDLIKPALLEHYEQHKYEWFPRDDTTENASFDRRTPGLFKEEFRCNAMVSLSSKNYICYLGDEIDKETKKPKMKLSAKGVQKSRNGDVLTPENFEAVVKNRTTFKDTNRGFRLCRETNSMITYTQMKTSLNYFYDKRRVLEDGITTAPLDI